ncbi:aspartic peptidase domain-containing protein [Crepidotus variabilis]|uniref:Aspartic peptidase domain-containing protein n=1 Tax=Crepidotus variabilis TaxID=179855 RepID=A0A9P6JS41_9AGAR|nr:aspartic peptidase domain-containing protein [Crepidotus variabilis]
MGRSTFLTYVSFFTALTYVSALNVPFERRAPRGVYAASPLSPSRYSLSASTDSEKVGNVNDMRYTTNITVNGKSVTVALDTGSTDLWVNPPGGIGPFNDTKIPVTLAYGDGSYGAKGTIGVGPATLGTYTVEKQAFLDVTQSTIKGLDDIGVYGILGLTFDLAQASKINDAIKAIDGDDATWGHSFLHNVFDQHPDQPNFIAIDLARSDDLEDTVGGSFYIGEYDPTYAGVAKAPHLTQFPEGGNRWTILMEAIEVGGSAVPFKTSIKGVPSGQAQTLLDTGNPNALFPTSTWNAIYSKIPGAVTSSDLGVWILPCNTTTLVELTFGGEKFPIHPLDLSTISEPIDLPDGRTVTACVSALQGADGFSDDGFEVALGDSFLRNVYSVYDFGDAKTKPYIQLLNQITPDKAVAQVASIRGKTLATLPIEISPAELLQIISSDSNALPTSTDTPIEPTGKSSANNKSKTSTSELSTDGNGLNLNVDTEDLKKYGLIAIGLLCVNALIGVVLIVFAVLNCVRKGATRKSGPIMASSQYAPVKLQDDYGHAPSSYATEPKHYGQ